MDFLQVSLLYCAKATVLDTHKLENLSVVGCGHRSSLHSHDPGEDASLLELHNPPPNVCIQVAPETVPEFLPGLAEVASLQHFSHSRNLQETIWNQLPAIAAGLGKRVRPHPKSAAQGLHWCLLILLLDALQLQSVLSQYFSATSKHRAESEHLGLGAVCALHHQMR